VKHIHFLWFRFNKPQSYCTWAYPGMALSWNKREIDCPRCLEHLDSR
jgi:hypothetical protein